MKDTLIGDILMDINPTTFYYKQDHDQGAFHRISPGSVIEALKYVTVLWSTYKMIKEIFVEYQKLKNNPKEVQIQAIQDAWTVHLAQAQLTSENSRLIAKEHAAHVLTLLDKKYGC